MAFTTTKFLGATVLSFSSSIGWGIGQPSTLTVQLAEDPVDGDAFLATDADIGTPVYFQFYSFTFNGILQKIEQRKGQDGNPVYEAVVVDPREILEAAQVILGAYYGSTAGMKNLFNVFGWWENQIGFGASQGNESGMPWHLVRGALLTMANNPLGSDYGGPLNFRGVNYGLDLSQIPNPPSYYRVGGVAVGLMELIAQLCEDGGADFFVELVGTTIRVRTVNRYTQPPLGTIAAVANTATLSGTCLRTHDGLELRNELTSSFLIGGEQTSLHQTESLVQFWGYDISGEPIIGEQIDLEIRNRNGGVLQTITTEKMLLNAAPVFDIIGTNIYQCTTLEMRMALVNYDSWACYIAGQRPTINLFIKAPLLNQGVNQALVKNDVVNDDRNNALAIAQGLENEFWVKAMRLYEFVRGYAQNYLGKKFLVSIPFVLQKQDTETLRVSYSQEPTDAGWLPEGSAPLGLSPLNEDVFKSADSRFQCFVLYTSVVGSDLSRVNPADTVIENDNLWMKATISPQIVFTPSPAVVLTLSNPLYEEALDIAGDVSIVAAVLQMAEADAQKVLKNGQFGNVGIKVFPAPRVPNFAAVPLKSNILTYGPWYASGAAGKVKVEYDPSLVPWNYGGFEVMNLSGNARVNTAISNMQVSEAGTIEIGGAPSASLGDTLQSGGPNLTNIDVSIGKDGVATTYRFATFTPRFGVFSKYNIERFKKLSLVNQELRKSLRVALREQEHNQELQANGIAGFLAHAPKAIKRESPHDVLIARNVQDGSNIRVGVSTATFEEAVGLAGAENNSDFKSTAVMSLAGLLRPFSTSGSGLLMPGLTQPSGSFLGSTSLINKTTYDPWTTTDVEVLQSGQTYTGLHSYRRGSGGLDARPMALRGPLVVSGWGWTIDGKKTPSDGSSGYLTNYQKRSDQWATGPVDLLWDQYRGVWTCHDILIGRTSALIAASGTGTLKVYNGPDDTGMRVPVSNWFNAGISGDLSVIANYCVTANKWYIVAADCR